MSATAVGDTTRLRPPVDETRKLLEQYARRIATLLARRQRHIKRIEAIQVELATARRFLRDLIRDVGEPVSIAPQTHIDDIS